MKNHGFKTEKIFCCSFPFSLGSDPEQLFPHALMMKHLRKFGKFGLIMASTLLPTITADRDRRINLDEDSSKDKRNDEKPPVMPKLIDHPLISNSSLKRFNKRLREVAIDMARLEYV